MPSFRPTVITVLFILLIVLTILNAYAVIELRNKYGDVSGTQISVPLNIVSLFILFIVTLLVFYYAFTTPYGNYTVGDQYRENDRVIRDLLGK